LVISRIRYTTFFDTKKTRNEKNYSNNGVDTKVDCLEQSHHGFVTISVAQSVCSFAAERQIVLVFVEIEAICNFKHFNNIYTPIFFDQCYGLLA